MIKFDHKHHRELWDWLSKNPDKGKEDWVGWKYNGGTVGEVKAGCFACEADSKESGDCESCPICEFDGQCLNGLYHRWNNSTGEQRSKYAAQIRDLPLRTDIEIELIGEDKVEFKVGDRVRIRQWNDMAKEFGVDTFGCIKVVHKFTKDMKHLCGRTATIKEIIGRYIELSDWSDYTNVDYFISADMLELASTPLHEITITSDGHTTTAKYGDKQGIAKCNPKDKFDIATGAKLALERALEPEFRPYLTNTRGDNYGEVGTPTSLVDIQGMPLFVGDVVAVYNDTRREYLKDSVVVAKHDNGFVFELRGVCFTKPKVSPNGWFIIKKRSYTEVKHNETVNYIKYIKEKQ